MALSQADAFIRQGHPIRVEWLGWSSDTYRLSRSGWDLATHENYMNDSMSVVLHNRQLGLIAEGDLLGYRGMHMRMVSDFRSAIGMLDNAIIQIKYMQIANKTYIQSNLEPFANFNWVDAEPTDSIMSKREWKVSDVTLFRKLAAPVEQELIVDPECVQSMLDQILKIQGPMRKDIRARDRKREENEVQTKQIHAQIISLKAA